MDNRTEINSQLNAAEMNLEAGQATVVNPHMAESSKLQAGTILAGKYEIVKSLSVSTGEADLYICKYADKEYVAKVYRRQRAVKPEVITVLKSIDSSYVASIYETGEYNHLPFVILPSYKKGRLHGKTNSLHVLTQVIIPCINDGL